MSTNSTVMLTGSKQQKTFRNWAVALCVLAFFIQYFTISLGGDIYNVLSLQFPDYTKGQISSMMTIGGAIAIPLYFFSGTIMRKINPRYILVPALLLAGLMVIWMPHTASYPQLMACIVLMTIGMKIFDFCMFGIVANWFLTQRGRMLGYITIAVPLASASFTNLSTRLSDVFGPIPVFGTYGAFVILIGVLCWFFMPRSPEDKGCYPDGIERTEDEIAAIKAKPAPAWKPRDLFRNKTFWLYSIGFGLLSLLMAAVMPLFVPRLLETGLERNLVLNLMSISSILGMFLSAVWGWIDDKLGTPVASIILALSYVLMMVSIRLQAQSMVWVMISVAGCAFGSGGIPNLNASLCSYIFGREQYMNVMRFAQPIQQLIRLISLVMMAYFYDTYGSYDMGYNICIVIGIAAVILVAMCRTTYDPERLAARQAGKAK